MATALAATGANSSTSYVAETSYGVTPSNPTMLATRFGAATFNLTKESFSSNERSDKRQLMGMTFGTRSGSGELPFEFSYGSFDDFLEATLGGSWNTNVLKIGNTKRTFTFEQRYGDINLNEQNTGVTLTGFNLSVKPDSIVTGSFQHQFKDQASVQYADDGTTTMAFAATTITRSAGSFVTDGFAIGDTVTVTGASTAANNKNIVLTGVSATVLTASAAGFTVDTAKTGVTLCKTLGNPTAANTNSVFDSFTGLAQVDGTTIAIVTGIDISVSQDSTASKVLFDSTAQQITLGRVNVTGSLVVRFINNEIKKKFLTGTDIDLSFTLGATSKLYRFDMSTVKLTSAQASSDEGELTQTMAFTALYNAGDASTIVVTRTP